jgi:dimethylhistidine N-methyltransferase
MAAPAHPREPRFEQLHRPDDAALRDELILGLRAAAPQIAPKFFYDELGSRLFEAITELPEYTPTRTEAAIFAAHRHEMAEAIGPGTTLIDLGAGNGRKAESLFDALRPARYVGVDISVEFVHAAVRRIAQAHPGVEVAGIGLDFSHSLDLPSWATEGRPLFFYPGSSIGNFSPDEALALLRRLQRRARGGGLLIGTDLVKPIPVLEAAYDDALGVTAAFNLNLLRHVNRTIGADFDPRDWRHVALFATAHSRIEMNLEARRDVAVQWNGGSRNFSAGARIHTENSYKYTLEGFAALLVQAGFAAPRCWTDPQVGFAVFYSPA